MSQNEAKRLHADRMVLQAIERQRQRETSYRERALKLYPWVCGRCAREFTRENLQQLTVHHRNHNHDDNPEDGSNWELLCVYCHENEHAKILDAAAVNQATGGGQGRQGARATAQPFADLKAMLAKKGERA